VKKLLLVLTTFLATPAYADTVTIGWWDKSIGGPVTALSATSGPITPTSPIVDIIQHPLLLGSGFGFDQVVAMVIPPTGNIMSGGFGGPSAHVSIFVQRRLRATAGRQHPPLCDVARRAHVRQLNHLAKPICYR
jgi:hypothetical protein